MEIHKGKQKLIAFKSHYPARGRKPSNLHPLVPLGSNLITPQGDGNVSKPLSLDQLSYCSNLITPQGDGNAGLLFVDFSIYTFKSRYPARGRKL